MDLFLSLLAAGILLIIISFFAVIKCYKKVPNQGMVLIVNQLREVAVFFTGGWVLPYIHTTELFDISTKNIVITRRGKVKNGNNNNNSGNSSSESEGLLCKDNIRADIDVTFYIGVNRDEKTIKEIINKLTVGVAGNKEKLSKYFEPKFSEALKTVAKKFEFEELYSMRKEFREEIRKIVSQDLEGFELQDVAIDYIEQSPLSAHDKDNILDVDGIMKITQKTATRHIETNEIRQDEETQIKQKDVSAESTRLELDRTKKEAEFKQKREIRAIDAEQNAEATKIEEESRLIRERAKIKAQETIDIENENKNREVTVTQINNARVTEIEAEKVNRAKLTEQVLTKREVSIESMEMEKAVEEKMKEVAEITSQKVSIQRKTAKEEEETLSLRNSAEVDRQRLVKVVDADGTAEASKVMKIKEAEALKIASQFKAEQVAIDANANLIKDEKAALGKAKLAEATRIEAAALGLAKVEVETAEAASIKARGEAEAIAIRSKGEAEGVAIRSKGEAEAETLSKKGIAEGVTIRSKGEAEAKNQEELGLAKAAGAAAEYKAMESITEETRTQELRKLEIDKEKEVELAAILVQKEAMIQNANVMAEAMKAANIELIGGDTKFFEQIMASVSGAKSLDRKVNNSKVLTALGSDYLTGERSLPEDIVGVLKENGNIGNLTLAQVLANPSALTNILSTQEGQALAKTLIASGALKS